MNLLDKLRFLGIDVHDQVSVIRTINSFAITDKDKTNMLRQYLSELNKPLNEEAGKQTRFPT